MINKKGGLVANTFAVILFLFMAFPVYWMVISAFKPREDFFLETPKFFPYPGDAGQLRPGSSTTRTSSTSRRTP